MSRELHGSQGPRVPRALVGLVRIDAQDVLQDARGEGCNPLRHKPRQLP